jgi:alpha-mannosidase
MLARTELFIKKHPERVSNDHSGDLQTAWETLLFNQFHDIVGGASIKAACEDAFEELGFAKTIARRLLVDVTRKIALALPDSRSQRALFFNLGDKPFSGLIDYEPWLTAKGKKVIDENGDVVQSALVPTEAAVDNREAFLLKLDIPPMGMRICEVVDGEPDQTESSAKFADNVISNDLISAKLAENGVAEIRASSGEVVLAGIETAVLKDESDTWTHRLSSFDGDSLGTFSAIDDWRCLESNSLRSTAVTTTKFGDSKLLWLVSIEEGAAALRLRLRLNWAESAKIAKLRIRPGFKPFDRMDEVPGGLLRRPLDGREYPLAGRLSLMGESGALTLLTRDVFGVDVQPDGTIGLTLTRSPLYLHHEPYEPSKPNAYPVMDQGVHEYDITILHSADGLDEERISRETTRLEKPVWTVESSAGMFTPKKS